MEINERIVINMPKNIRDATPTKRSTWIRHAILRSIWGVRNRIILDKAVDIFSVYIMTDCVEVNIKGDFQTRDVSQEKWYSVRAMFNQRKKKKEEEEESEWWNTIG